MTTTPAPTTQLLYSMEDSAEMLGVHQLTVCDLCRRGKLKYVAIGSQWLVSAHAMEEYIHAAELEKK